jgi:hypothetical protein
MALKTLSQRFHPCLGVGKQVVRRDLRTPGSMSAAGFQSGNSLLQTVQLAADDDFPDLFYSPGRIGGW